VPAALPAPAGGGVAVSAVLADPGLVAMGDHLLEPVLLNALILVTVAVSTTA
jgi:CBS domain-containing membrane protein